MSEKQYLHKDEQDETNVKNKFISDFSAIKFLMRYAAPRKKSFFIALFLMLLSSLVAIFSSRSMGFLVEKGLLVKDIDASTFWAISIIALEILGLAFQWSGRRILIINASSTILDIRKSLFNFIHKLPLNFYDRQPQGRVITRLTHDVEGVEEFFTSTIGRFVNAIFMAIIAASAMCITDLKLGLILVSSMLPAVLFVFATKKKVRDVNRSMSKHSSALNSKLNEYINGIDVIRSYGLEQWSRQNFDDAVISHQQAQLSANFLYAWSRPFTAFLCSLPLMGLVFFGGKAVMAGTLSVGVFVAFIRYCERFFSPIMMLAREIHVIQQALTSGERVASFFSHETELDVLGNNGSLNSVDLEGRIEFSNVWMSYNLDDWVLKDVSFNIEKGQKIGLVGTTGCGKTTTVSLLSRLYEFQKGDILVDGISIRDYERNFLRKSIGFVSQDPIIFHGSLRENLSADKDTTDEVLLDCAKTTGLLQVMQESAITLDSIVLENGENLSVGERQLLSLTRVLLQNPRILILDEATANIDPHYEKIIHNAVNEIMESKTCLIIAHRLDTIMSCDNLLVFNKGRLVESGNPRALLESKGFFASLQKATDKVQLKES
ncbi:ABC transporter ATP-binding protein [Halobacteriovorax sp. HLS]|uniref:ABC transporter ATP-binding protein n=1 Tax=Halobacteriovorax sp. HLS TaxID=2234000 RepID=UPI000FD6C6DB|nr:ABC transporter ATP-binding protein [Halobacteriovorax sp. HLS]